MLCLNIMNDINKQSGLTKEITTAVVALITENKIRQKAICEIIGKDKGTVSKIFKGEFNFSLEDLQEISLRTELPILPIVLSCFCEKGDLIPEDQNNIEVLKDVEQSLTSSLQQLNKLK